MRSLRQFVDLMRLNPLMKRNEVWCIAVIQVVLSLGGLGIVIGTPSPQSQLTNALANLTVFHVFLFEPALLPKEHLPALLQHFPVAMPTTFGADATRGARTDPQGTHPGSSLLAMAGVAAGWSVVLSAGAIRRRG